MKFEFGKFEINFKQIIVSNHIIFYRVLFNMKNNKNANFLKNTFWRHHHCLTKVEHLCVCSITNTNV